GVAHGTCWAPVGEAGWDHRPAGEPRTTSRAGSAPAKVLRAVGGHAFAANPGCVPWPRAGSFDVLFTFAERSVSKGERVHQDKSEQERAYALIDLGDEIITARALQIAAELKIADLLAAGPCSVEDLAGQTGSEAGALHRMMRLLASRGLFCEVEPGVFELTGKGGPLRSDHPLSVRSVLTLTGAVAPVVMDGVHHSLRTGEATFPAVTGQDIYDHMVHHPEQGRLFDEAMQELTLVVTPAVLDAYDFSEASRIIDVGGGSGALLNAILHHEPEANGIVFDTPRAADLARERIRQQGLADRCSVMGGDFFGEIPAG